MILIDTANLYQNVKKKYKNSTVRYSKLIKYIEEVHGQQEKIAYIANIPDVASFITYFKNLNNTEIELKKPNSQGTANFNVDLSIDALTCKYDQLIICSSSIELLPLVEYLFEERVAITIYGIGLTKKFNKFAQIVEIEERFLRQRCGTKKD